MKKLTQQLIDKSIESFLMAIEVYNKPTIRYRVEGFSMFICNAWELLLKAQLIQQDGEPTIYYRDNPSRTISLENCVDKVFTNRKAPLRLNLERIIELRNTSTHFITEEYEMVYMPLFQSCVFNFTEKINDFFDVDMTKHIPQNFLALAVSMRPLDVNEIRAKYPVELADKLISTSESIANAPENQSPAFAVRIEHYHYLTKDEAKATSVVRIDQSAKNGATIIKQMQDPAETHKYRAKDCIEQIARKLRSSDTDFAINSYSFNVLVKYYRVKENPKFCYCYTQSKIPLYTYSMLAIELLATEIEKDPDNIIRVAKERLSKKKS